MNLFLNKNLSCSSSVPPTSILDQHATILFVVIKHIDISFFISHTYLLDTEVHRLCRKSKGFSILIKLVKIEHRLYRTSTLHLPGQSLFLLLLLAYVPQTIATRSVTRQRLYSTIKALHHACPHHLPPTHKHRHTHTTYTYYTHPTKTCTHTCIHTTLPHHPHTPHTLTLHTLTPHIAHTTKACTCMHTCMHTHHTPHTTPHHTPHHTSTLCTHSQHTQRQSHTNTHTCTHHLQHHTQNTKTHMHTHPYHTHSTSHTHHTHTSDRQTDKQTDRHIALTRSFY